MNIPIKMQMRTKLNKPTLKYKHFVIQEFKLLPSSLPNPNWDPNVLKTILTVHCLVVVDFNGYFTFVKITR